MELILMILEVRLGFGGLKLMWVLMIGAVSPTIGNFYNIRVSPPERTTPSTAKSSSIVDRDGKSKEKDPVGGVSLAEAPAFKKAPGGAPANVAVGIARLGGSAAFVGKVGDDEFGYMLSDILKQNNVDNSGVCFDSKLRTALTFVTLRADGEREFMFFRNPSTDMLLRESELNKDLLKKISEGEISFLTGGADPSDDQRSYFTIILSFCW